MTINVTFCEWLVAPLVPVIVRVKVPTAPPLSPEMVSVELPVPPGDKVTEGGLKLAVVLLGRALTDRLTLPLKLLSEVSVTAYVTLPGRTSVLVDGLTLMLKSGALGIGVLVGVLVGVFVGVFVGVLVATGTAVLVGVLVATGTGVLVGVGGMPPQPGNLKLPMRVRQLNVPVV